MIKTPVVAVLGHIDHGKSSLLEAIKEDFKITSRESGGITQHVGAYQVSQEDKKITFVDTPGHEAFSEMRSRGANVADIAILVIAADRGVQPQTKEAIESVNKTGIPLIIALNKIDKDNANPSKVKTELQSHGVLIEEFGGKVPLVETSAKDKQGIGELLEIITLQWEMQEKEAELESPFEGFIIEGHLDHFRGATGTLIVEKGILEKGDIIGSSSTFAKIKTLEDFNFEPLEKAIPGDPAVITGFEGIPLLGERFKKYNSVEEAQNQIEKGPSEFKGASGQYQEDALNVILKTDVKGSLEVVAKILENIKEGNKTVNIVKGEVGKVNTSDLKLAQSTSSKVLAFRVRNSSQVEALAKQQQTDLLNFETVYEIIDKVKELIKKEKIEKREVKKELGTIKPLVIFKTQSKKGGRYRQVVGGRIEEGEVKKGTEIEVWRGEEDSSPSSTKSSPSSTKIGKGDILELQKQKANVEKAKSGDEIGILYEGNGKIKEGDFLKVYTTVVEEV